MYKILIFVFTLFCFLNPCIANDNFNNSSPDKRADDTINQMINHRIEIYKKLDLTVEQQNKINIIDSKFYDRVRPKFISNYVAVDEMLKMSEIPNCKKKDLKSKVKEIKISDRKYFNEIKKDYRNEFDIILTPQQKKLYSKLKKEKIKEMKLEYKTNKKSN